MINYALLSGVLLAVTAHSIAWFGSNSQFLWQSWRTNPLYSVILFGIPSNIMFWLASRSIYGETKSIWQIRWIMFAASFPAMYALSKIFLNETFFTNKNILTLLLAIAIIFVQFHFKAEQQSSRGVGEQWITPWTKRKNSFWKLFTKAREIGRAHV